MRNERLSRGANPGPDSPINFVHKGLKPNSEITFTLQTSSGESVAGLQVSGAVVVRADAQGNYEGDISLPATVADGVYSLTVAGTYAYGSAYNQTYSISTSNGAVTQAESTSLALTGVDSRRTAFNGVLIVAMGLALVAFAARTRTSEVVTTDA